MSHKFRFSEKCIDRLKEYCGKLDKGGKVRPEPAARKKAKDLADTAEMPAIHEVPSFEIPDVPGVIALTDRGCVRPNNQDAVIVAPALAGVADGMGGHRGGEVASSGARDLLLEFLSGKQPDETELKTAVECVNQRLFIQQAEDASLAGMGTTLTVLWAGDEKLFIAHVGDSRAYRLRDGKLEQVTHDHSMVEEMVRQGIITPEQAACHPMRNVITRAVATEAGIDVDLLIEPRCAGDLWLLCSDGLHGMVSDLRMQEILTENPPKEAADLLMAAAKEAGGRDNISLVIYLDGEAADE